MVQSSHSRTAALALTSAAAIALVATACSRGSNVSNAAPRISSVPAQSTLGGTAFSLDLGDYVTDREGATLTFAVTSGGGSFTDDTYTNTFDAMGTYTVSFTVNDGAKVATGSFDVQVTTSNFVVVQEDTAGLFLLDSGTNGQVRVASAVGSPTFAAGLADGRMAYQVGGTQLWLFDPMNRTSRRLAGDAAGAATFRAKTSDSRLFYTTGSAPDMTLSYYN
ncbi:MAG: hypothetical protein KDE27_23565, partial [Planctomycetes bacterium]|nr:hypothetical protein [Planctomycetota bacterium]